jgi:sulfur transfer complex TusBCD TusB component (DsrH family)
MGTTVIVVKGAPDSAGASEGFRLAVACAAAGGAATVILLQDATLCATASGATPGHSLIADLLAAGAALLCLEEDLAMRGFASRDLRPGVESIGYGRLVEVMAGPGVRVIGVL